jgi:hypothetical protein
MRPPRANNPSPWSRLQGQEPWRPRPTPRRNVRTFCRSYHSLGNPVPAITWVYLASFQSSLLALSFFVFRFSFSAPVARKRAQSKSPNSHRASPVSAPQAGITRSTVNIEIGRKKATGARKQNSGWQESEGQGNQARCRQVCAAAGLWGGYFDAGREACSLA